MQVQISNPPNRIEGIFEAQERTFCIPTLGFNPMKMKRKKFSRNLTDNPSVRSFHDYEGIQSDENDSDGALNKLPQESEESSEEEVFPVHSDVESESSESEGEDLLNIDVQEGSNDELISDSDLDQPDDDLLDSKAWGRRKRQFYNADHINDKNDYWNEEDEEAAKMEEEEAKIIQKRLLSEIDNADLSLDLLPDASLEKTEQRSGDKEEKIFLNLSQMNKHEKLKLLKRESPKFLPSIENYKRYMKLMLNDLLPVIKCVKPGHLLSSSTGKFIRAYSQLIMNYCTNVSFFILLKSRRSDYDSHPVHNRLIQYQQILEKMEPIYDEQIKPQIELMLQNKMNHITVNQKRKKKKSIFVEPADFETDSRCYNEDVISNNVDELTSADLELNDADEKDIDGKRPITYEIAKNKGLTPHRKKELRNPRVKHRMKYRKAKIRRKGQVREVRKEVQKYSGEISGIKSNVIKSVKLKN